MAGKYTLRCIVRHIALPRFSPDLARHFQDWFTITEYGRELGFGAASV